MAQSKAQLDNLKRGNPKTQFRAGREQSETARKGGIASGESRRRAYSFNETIKKLARTPMHEGELADLENLSSIEELAGSNLTTGEQMALMVLLKAQKGDMRALELVQGVIADDTGDIEADRRHDLGLSWQSFWNNISPAFGQVAGDIFRHNHVHYTFPGGRGSMKSSFVSLVVVLLIMQNPEYHALVLRKVGSTIRDSILAQYEWAVSTLGVEEHWAVRTSPPELTYKPTGQKILMRGVDDPGKIKSIKVPFGYIAVTHFEELDQFGGREETRNVLQSTMRGGQVFWNFESFNPPISRMNWANEDILKDRKDRLITFSNYLQAPAEWLGDQFFLEAENLKLTNERAYQHEYMGEPVGTGGEVFDNLDLRPITEEEIAIFDNILMGVDWGWYPDPYHWAKMHFDSARRTLYIFDELHVNKMSNDETWRILSEEKGVTGSDLITADSAEPKSVGDYRAYGAMCRGAIKGKDSVTYGIKWLQSLRKIVIDPARCPATAMEFSQYEYERTKDGEILTGYPDANNHSIDAVRYGTESIWKKKGQ